MANPVLNKNSAPKKSIFLAKAQGAQRAETGMYVVVHEDFEHCVTPRLNKKMIFNE